MLSHHCRASDNM